jgi:hypothetical protein
MHIQARSRSALSPSTGSWITGGLLAIVMLAGCSAAVATDGPLTDNGTPGEECSPVPRGGVLSDGFEVLTNTAGPSVTVTHVGLASPHHLRVLAAYIVPVTGHDLYGVRSGFPPAASLPPGVLWSQRQRASGARIPRTTRGHVVNLVVVIKPSASGGRAKGIEVDYTASGQRYSMTTATSLQIVVGRSCPE